MGGDEKLFDKKRKIQFKDKCAMLPVTEPLSDDLIQKLNTISSFDIRVLDQIDSELLVNSDGCKEKLDKRIKDLLPQHPQNDALLMTNSEVPKLTCCRVMIHGSGERRME